MKPPPRPARGILALSLAGATALALGAWGMAPRPRTAPALPGEVHDRVTSFAFDHPEWAALRDKRQDTTPLLFNHKAHVGLGDAVKPRVAEMLAAMADPARSHPLAGHIERDAAGRLAMACTFCHQPDQSGRGMEPIRFAAHCADCHTENLGKADMGDPALAAQVYPHGSPADAAALIERRLLAWAARDPSRFAPAAAAPGEAAPAPAPPADDGGGRRRRGAAGEGPRRGGGGAALPAFADPAAFDAWFKEQRGEALDRLDGKCAYCHTDVQPGPEGDPALFRVADPAIPDLWLTRSVFDHAAHTLMACTSCHAGTPASERTADILLPGIESCRACHSPAGHSPRGGGAAAAGASPASLGSGGAPDNCVLCHVYHRPTAANQGALGITTGNRGPTAVLPAVPAAVPPVAPVAAPAAP